MALVSAKGSERLIRSLSVGIPAHNADAVILEQLEAIQRQDASWLDEVIVADSLSTDGTASVVQEFASSWPKVRVVRAARAGANVARNAAAAASSSDAVILCDADDVVGDGWLEALFQALQSCDVVRGRYALDALNDPDVVAARGLLASTDPPVEGELFGGLGGNCGFRRSAWEQLGGLLEHHYGSDDAEFFWRAHLAGMRVGYVHEAVVHYRLRPGYSSLFRQQMQWASGRALLFKEFGGSGLIERRSLWSAAKAWVWLAIHLPDRFSSTPSRKGRWVRHAAESYGRLRGSLRHRVFYL